MSSHIKELTTIAEWKEAYPVMKQLRSHLDMDTYVDLVEEATEKENYRLLAQYNNEEEIVAVIGFHPMITLYYGHFIWVCDLVTDERQRSNGWGEKLLSYVHDWADGEGYDCVALSSGLQRKPAHDFYEQKMDYDKVSYVFKHTFS